MKKSQKFILKSVTDNGTDYEKLLQHILSEFRMNGLEIGAEYFPWDETYISSRLPFSITISGQMPAEMIRFYFYRLMVEDCPDLWYYPEEFFEMPIQPKKSNLERAIAQENLQRSRKPKQSPQYESAAKKD